MISSKFLNYTRIFLVMITLCVSLKICGEALIQLLDSCNKGFDISDEGFAYLSMRASTLGQVYGSPFALYTKVLYQITGGQIVTFREVSISISVVSAFIMGSHIPSGSSGSFLASVWRRLLFGVTTSVSAMYFYSSYIRSPSYNWLVFNCLIVGMTALLREYRNTEAKYDCRSWLNLSVFSSACWISSFGKPSSGPFLLVLLVLVLALTRSRKYWRRSLIQLFSSFIPIMTYHHFYVLSLEKSWALMQRGIDTLRIQDPEYYTVRNAIANVINTTRLIPNEILTQQFSLVMVTTLSFLILKFYLKFEYLRLLKWLLYAVLIYWLISKRWESLHKSSFIGISPTAVLFFLALTLAISQLFGLKRFVRGETNTFHFDKPVVALALSLCCGIYAFGSNSGFYRAMSEVFIFAISAALLLVEKRIATRSMVWILLLVSIPMSNLLHLAEKNPYRTAPIHEATFSFPSTTDFAGLFVDHRTFVFAQNLLKITSDNGWDEGDEIIDMTRFSPGLVFLLGASTPPDVLTTVGQYAGTDRLIRRALLSMSRDFQCTAWVLTSAEDFSPVTKDKTICGKLFPEGLVQVGKVTWWVNDETITVWRPVRTTGS